MLHAPKIESFWRKGKENFKLAMQKIRERKCKWLYAIRVSNSVHVFTLQAVEYCAQDSDLNWKILFVQAVGFGPFDFVTC